MLQPVLSAAQPCENAVFIFTLPPLIKYLQTSKQNTSFEQEIMPYRCSMCHGPWNAATHSVRSIFCLQAPCSLCGRPTHVRQPNRFCTWCSTKQGAYLFAEEFSKPLLSSWWMDTVQRKGSLLCYHLQCPVKNISVVKLLLSSLPWVNYNNSKPSACICSFWNYLKNRVRSLQ